MTTTVPAIDITRLDRGKITVRSTATGDHRTFRISQSAGRDGQPTTWVGLLSGPDNQDDYISFARITNGRVQCFYKHRGTQYEKLADMLTQLPRLDAKGKVEMLHSGSCLRCGRELTEPESIESGFGPVCRERLEI